jgi:hypothetical protein
MEEEKGKMEREICTLYVNHVLVRAASKRKGDSNVRVKSHFYFRPEDAHKDARVLQSRDVAILACCTPYLCEIQGDGTITSDGAL